MRPFPKAEGNGASQVSDFLVTGAAFLLLLSFCFVYFFREGWGWGLLLFISLFCFVSLFVCLCFNIRGTLVMGRRPVGKCFAFL